MCTVSRILPVSAAACLLSFTALAQPTMSRDQVLRVFESAIARFQKECGFTIMQARLPGTVNCGRGAETIGTAWDRMLVQSGLPSSYKAREQIAADLKLDPSTSLVLQGMARAEGIDHLLSQLR